MSVDETEPELPAGFFDLVIKRSRRPGPPRPVLDVNPPPVSPGQVWRAEWEGAIAIVVVTGTRGSRDAEVSPVNEDTGLADARTVVVPADRSPLGHTFGVWATPSTTIPTVALDRHLGNLAPTDLHKLAGLLTAAGRPGPPVDLTYPPAAHRHALEATLVGFDELRRLLAGEHPETTDLGDLLAAASMKWSTLATDANIDAPTLRKVQQGAPGVLDMAAVARVADALGLHVDEVMAALPRVPVALRLALHQPRHRHQVRERARRTETSIGEVRRVVARELVGARRRQRAGTDEDWDELLDAYFGDDG
ncbi:MAG TPA: helix-turn-helix transcriptional regulator [Euzebya sp.]|nr:helix-turn-helix transcriptional regulator [Euzebya sp.]